MLIFVKTAHVIPAGSVGAFKRKVRHRMGHLNGDTCESFEGTVLRECDAVKEWELSMGTLSS